MFVIFTSITLIVHSLVIIKIKNYIDYKFDM